MGSVPTSCKVSGVGIVRSRYDTMTVSVSNTLQYNNKRTKVIRVKKLPTHM
jgi:hypothetical protein